MRCGSIVALALSASASAACTSSSNACDEQVPGTVCKLAGNGEFVNGPDGLAADQTSLYLPTEARRGPDDLIWIMDFNNYRLRRIEADNTISTVAGNGLHGEALAGTLATASPLENPIDFDFLPNGQVIFAQYHNYPQLLTIDSNNLLQVVAGGQSGVLGWEGDGGPATTAEFIQIAAVVVAPDGTIYVADDSANRVRVIKDGIINTLAGTGVPSYGGDGGPATSAGLSAPSALALDAAGNVFIADTFNCAIRKVDTSGTITTVAGIGKHGFDGDGGAATSAALAEPAGIAVAADGTLYIGDSSNARLRMISNDGTIQTIAGNGTPAETGDGGPASHAELGSPIGRVQFDTDGGVLFADESNGVVRKILPPRSP